MKSNKRQISISSQLIYYYIGFRENLELSVQMFHESWKRHFNLSFTLGLLALLLEIED